MPITVTRLIPHVYQAIWSGFITVDVATRMLDEIALNLELQHENSAALVIDVSPDTRLMFGIQDCRRLVDANPYLFAYVFVHAPLTAHVITHVLEKITNRRYDFADTIDAAVNIAQNMLQRV